MKRKFTSKRSGQLLKKLLPVVLLMFVSLAELFAQCNGTLTCNGNLNISVDVNCEVLICADMVLEGGNPACFDSYNVTVEGLTPPNALVGNGTTCVTVKANQLDSWENGSSAEFAISVTNPNGNNSCWNDGWVIEDKKDPILDCPAPVTIACTADPDDPNVVPVPVVTENCGAFELDHVDVVSTFDCTTGAAFAKVINRFWTVEDDYGNTATCLQIINVNFAQVGDVMPPPDYDNIDQPALGCDKGDVSNCSDPGWNVLATGPYAGNPSPDNVIENGCEVLTGTGYPTGGCDNFQFTYEDLDIWICDGSDKVIRTWTILDWCTGNVSQHDQIIKILDSEAPAFDPPLVDITASTTNNSCEATVELPVPVMTDNCSNNTYYTATSSAGNISLNAGVYVITGLPVGTHVVTYEASDHCDNTATATFNVIVIDGIAPVSICETFHVVSLTTFEPVLVLATVLDDGSYDNCGIEKVEIRRMSPPSPCIDLDWTTAGGGIDEIPNGVVTEHDRGITYWYPAVPFACCDVGGEHLVEFRVEDVNENSNICMVTVTVDDKLDPVITCPTNATYQCSEYYNEPEDLPIDGLNQNGQGAPAFYVNLNGPGSADNDTISVGHYTNASDNCNATVYIHDTRYINNCGISTIDAAGNNPGPIQRFYTAVDDGGRTDVCVQLISVVSSIPYPGPLSFPSDVTINSCEPLTDPAQTGMPDISNDNTCSQVAISDPIDIELEIVDGSCKKILRTWIVIDWCNYDENSGDGYWEDTQIIKVINSDDPVFVNGCEVQSFCVDSGASGDCLGDVTLTVLVEDDCTSPEDINYTYWIDVDNDGTDDIGGNTNSYTSVNDPFQFTEGIHSVIWTAEDGCGNISTCEYLFTVNDCDGPTAYAVNGLAVDLGQQGEAEVWATDLNNGSFDNCSDICDYRIGVPSGGPGQTAPPTADHHVFDCDDLVGGPIPVDLWVKDCANNWAYVTTYVLVEDNSDICDGPFPDEAKIFGYIETEMAEGVDSVEVALTGNAPDISTLIYTNTNGSYTTPYLPLNYNYTVNPGLNLDPMNGVSTYDLLLISKHILDVQALGSPYKRIAADVNNSGSITTFDLVALRKLILFIDTAFQNNSSWRFVEADFVFNDPANPWATTFPEVTQINGLTFNELASFIGVKIGDVNNSTIPNGLVGGEGRTTVGDLVFQVEDQQLIAGEEYTVNFKAKDFNKITGYQFTLSFDQSIIEFVDMSTGNLAQLSDANFGLNKINEGIITTSWNNTKATILNNNENVFSVTFKAKSAATLSEVLNVSSRYTIAEAYNAKLELMGVAIEYKKENNVAVADHRFNLYQNTPNPFKDETVIGFNLPEATTASLKVYSVSGRLLKMVEGAFDKGYNEITMKRSELIGTGVLYYTLETATDSATKKMIIVE